jgi:hypothetical protein
MKRFLILYHSPVSALDMMANATPDQAKAGMDLWMAWAGKAGTALKDLGSPLGATEALAPDGDRTPSPSTVGGYSVLEAESWEALTKLLAGHPHFHAPGASIVAHEFLALPGM